MRPAGRRSLEATVRGRDVPRHLGRRGHCMSRTRKRRRNKPSPEPDTMTAVASPTDLKRLAFVESAAVNSVSYVTGTTAFAKACGYYTSAKEINALKVREISGPRTRATRRARAPTRESRATTPETRRRRAPRRPAALARPTRASRRRRPVASFSSFLPRSVHASSDSSSNPASHAFSPPLLSARVAPPPPSFDHRRAPSPRSRT